MKMFSLLVAVAALVVSGSPGFAGQATPTAFQQLYPHGDHGARQVSAPTGYRCRGVSYGTGAQSCGTATGGPVGGINSRN